MAQQQGGGSGSDEGDLRSLMAKLLEAYNEEDDNELPHKEELRKIFDILQANDGKITSQPPVLEKKAAEDLGMLLRDIDGVLQQRKAWWEQQRSPAAKSKSKKKTMPSVSDCNPFKSRAPEKQDDTSSPAAAAAASDVVDILLRRTKEILGDAPLAEGTTEWYQWTTSYIEEENIYGWDKEATNVAIALVGGDEDEAAEEGKDKDAAEGKDKDAEEGKEKEKKKKKDGEEILFRAAGIVGIHGSGKTALAQKVFVHDKIKDAFPLRLWVCVGPPDHEDRAHLLYRMLDNLGVDTHKVEAIVNDADVVKKAAADDAAAAGAADAAASAAAAGGSAGSKGGSKEKDSKIGVLLFILHVTLHRTGHPYLIVFDDIRAYDGPAGWYSNLPLPPPRKADAEWYDRLAYGLPKTRKSAVLVTCRKEDDARAMVRTGRVFRPPELDTDNGWKLFEREYNEAKAKQDKEREKNGEARKEKEEEEDKLYYKMLEKMKEQIVIKCLGLPVAIIEAARGFAKLPPHDRPEPEAEEEAKPAAAGETAPPPPATSSSTTTDEPAKE